MVNLRHNVLAYLALLCILPVGLAQILEWAPCAADCIIQLTNQSTSCQDGFRCFCTDDRLYSDALDCWSANCSIRDALVSQNITALDCGFEDRNRGAVGTAVTFASMGVALLFVGMHVMAFTITRTWGWGDLLIWLVTFLMIGNAVCNPFARQNGLGRDVWRLEFSQVAEANKIFYIGGIMYVAAVALTKMAFLLFYIRLFPTKNFGRIAYPLLAITFIQGMIFTFLFIFQCSPINYTWLQWDGEAEGTCLNFDIGAALHAIVNIILDFLIFALPVFQLRRLNMSKKKRWQVLSMFAVGFFVTLISVVRLTSLVHLGDSINLTYDYIPLAYFSDLELNIGVACFCMPAARVVIRRYFPHCGIATTGHDSAGHDNNHTNSRVRELPTNHTIGSSGKKAYGHGYGKGSHSATLSGASSVGKGGRVKVPVFVSSGTARSKKGGAGEGQDEDEVELRPYAQSNGVEDRV